MFFKKSDSYPNLWKSKNTVNIYFSLVQFKNHFLLIPHINKCCLFPLGFGCCTLQTLVEISHPLADTRHTPKHKVKMAGATSHSI